MNFPVVVDKIHEFYLHNIIQSPYQYQSTMTLFNNRFRSEPNRWQWWDYSAPGSYFITVCILDKHPLLGQIIDGEMHLSECGIIVAQQFPLIAEYHPRVRLDEWVIMPDHIHCIITLGDYQHHNGIAVAGDNTGGGDNGGGVVGVVDKIHEFYLRLSPQQTPDPPTADHNHIHRRKCHRKKSTAIFTAEYDIVKKTQRYSPPKTASSKRTSRYPSPITVF